MILTMAIMNNWHTRQLDYVLAFPQAPVERELYMRIPKGFEINGGNSDDYLLKIHRNIYGQKQAGRVWNRYLVNKLVNELGFQQSKIDECVFYKGSMIYALYTDDSILVGPSKNEIDEVIKQMKKINLDITDEGTLEDFLGVNIERKPNGDIHLTQPHLIDQILKDLRLDKENVKERSTPAACSKLLTGHTGSEDFDKSFHYRSVIGKLNYLEKCTRPDIAYITHQCARYTANPKKEHADAVRWLGRYLKGNRNKGLILSPNKSRTLKVYVDADFAGNWCKEDAYHRDTARSRHGYIIQYSGCPIIWKSQLQTEIALSSTESEYTGLSYALREAIPIMNMMREMNQRGYKVGDSEGRIYCRVFEDNSGALEMANTHKYRPRTKHLNVKLHHFRDYVSRKEITVHPIDTKKQPADILTKALNEELVRKHRMKIMGW